MSLTSTYLRKVYSSDDKYPIGTILPGYVINSASSTNLKNDGKWIKANTVYLQADYPQLYAQIGKHGATVFTTATNSPTPVSTPAVMTDGSKIYVGYDYRIYTSTDAANWATVSVGGITINKICNEIIYANSLYVLCNDNGDIASSTNGTNWTIRVTGTGTYLNALTFGNSLYITGGRGGSIYTSTNAANWTSRTVGSTDNVNGIAYGAGVYVAVCDGGVIRSSTNALNWTARTSGTVSPLEDIIFANNLFVAASEEVILTSTNGANWATVTAGNYYGMIHQRYLNNLFVGTCNRSTFYNIKTSTNGTNWITYDSLYNSPGTPVYFANTYFFYSSSPNGAIKTTDFSTVGESSLYNVSTEFLVPSISGVFTSETFLNTSNDYYIRAK